MRTGARECTVCCAIFDDDYAFEIEKTLRVESRLFTGGQRLRASEALAGGRAPGDTNQDFTINPQGLGTAVNGGWRDLLWGAGASFMMKSRPAGYGGNLSAFSTDFYFNLGRIWLKFPLMIMGEYAFGRYSGALATDRNFSANFLELSYLVFNGVNLKVNHHFYDADLSSRGNESGRFGLGFELIPVTVMKLYFEYRVPWRVTASQIKSDGLVNPFDWLGDKQFVFIGHVYF